jgi:hypothetical protein
MDDRNAEVAERLDLGGRDAMPEPIDASEMPAANRLSDLIALGVSATGGGNSVRDDLR